MLLSMTNQLVNTMDKVLVASIADSHNASSNPIQANPQMSLQARRAPDRVMSISTTQ